MAGTETKVWFGSEIVHSGRLATQTISSLDLPLLIARRQFGRDSGIMDSGLRGFMISQEFRTSWNFSRPEKSKVVRRSQAQRIRSARRRKRIDRVLEAQKQSGSASRKREIIYLTNHGVRRIFPAWK